MATNATNKIIVPETMQQGDTFTLLFQYKEGDVAMVLPSGYDMVVAFYDRKNKPIQIGKVSDGTISYLGDNTYGMDVPHESSLLMTSSVYLEVTILTENKTIVDHAKQIVEFPFETRKNNDLI